MKSWIDKNYKIGFPKARGELGDIRFPCYADTKYDGELNFIIVKDGRMEIVNKDKYGRHRTDFPALEELKRFGFQDGLILSGELYYGNDVYDFLRNKDNDELQLAIFDAWRFVEPSPNIYQPCEKLTYKERREWLENIFAGQVLNHVRLTECLLVNNKDELMDARKDAILNGREGLIAKSPGSIWQNLDIKSWTKLKKEQTADLIVMGYSRDAKYLSLLLGYRDDAGQLIQLCGCGSGLTFQQKLTYAKLLEQDALPPHSQTSKDYILTEPKLMAEVTFQEITKMNGKISALRHPVFLRFRDDKSVDEVSLL